jgi:molybdenum cofactor synthesis domain-containing protein
VAAAPLEAEERVPPFANTAMDGYAVRAVDTAGAPVRLRVVGTLAAGAAPAREVGPGEAIRIMTGAPMPPGADAVVMVERTRPGDAGDEVVIDVEASRGDHVRHAGEDVEEGDVVVDAGTVLRPAHLGVLASVGYQRVPVHPRVSVGVLSTGDELVEGSAPLAPGQIRDSNRPMLRALAEEAGAVPVDLGHASDDADALAAVLRDGAAGCDALLTTGGVSVGDFDHMKRVLAHIGRMDAWQVAIRPAKPLAFGVVDGTPVFGLPGNPVSALVSFELFARPALRKMMGHVALGRPEVRAVADDGLARRPDGKIHFVRVIAAYGEDGRVHVCSAGGQASHQLRATAAANALAVVPDGDGVAPGGDVRVLLLS